MATKAELAEQIVRLENPGSTDEDALAFSAKAMEKGFRKDVLEDRLTKLLAPPAPAELPPGTNGDEPGVELEERPEAALPSMTKWQQITAMAEYLSKSGLIPEKLRGKPYDVGAILLKSHDLGIPGTMGIEQLYVIKGKVGQEAKLMRALVRRDGHSIRFDENSNRFQAWVHGQRADNGDVATGTFDLDDAVRFDLIQGYEVRDGGEVVIRGKSDKPQWLKDTANMLKERACSRLCRDLFSDCLAGVSYTPDELGYIDAEEPAADPDEPSITANQQRSDIARRISDLPDDLTDQLRDEWKRRNFPSPDKLRPSAIRTALQMLEQAEAAAAQRKAEDEKGVDDAELVDENAGDGEGPGEAGEEPEPGTADAPGSVAAAAPSPSSGAEDGEQERCISCNEPGTDERPLVYDDQQRPVHADESVF